MTSPTHSALQLQAPTCSCRTTQLQDRTSPTHSAFWTGLHPLSSAAAGQGQPHLLSFAAAGPGPLSFAAAGQVKPGPAPPTQLCSCRTGQARTSPTHSALQLQDRSSQDQPHPLSFAAAGQAKPGPAPPTQLCSFRPRTTQLCSCRTGQARTSRPHSALQLQAQDHSALQLQDRSSQYQPHPLSFAAAGPTHFSCKAEGQVKPGPAPPTLSFAAEGQVKPGPAPLTYGFLPAPPYLAFQLPLSFSAAT